MPPQPASGRDARITQWAAASGQIGSPADFAARLDGAQVGAELLEIFRESLDQWMMGQGWVRWSPPTDLAMIANLTWRRDEWIATDVRPENALLAEADGRIHAIDFIIGRI